MAHTPSSRSHKQEMRSEKPSKKFGSNYDKPKPTKKKKPKTKKKY